MPRLLQTIVWLLLLSGSSALWSQAPGEYVFVARRSGIAEVVDAATLITVARVQFGFQVERLSAGADGSSLNVEGYAAGTPCCKHYSLDLASGNLTESGPPRVVNSYGPCLVSPDGSWCYQLKSFRGPALRVVDLVHHGIAHELIPPNLPPENSAGNWHATGAWSGDRFYLYVQRPNDPGFLWTVLPGAEALGQGIQVTPFNAAAACGGQLPTDRGIVAAAGNVFLYELFGSKADRAGACGAALPGGAWQLDPDTGKLTNQVASEFRFNNLIPDPSGQALYGVALGNSQWQGPVQIVKLDPRDGKVIQTRTFDPGVLQISVGPLAKAPIGDVLAIVTRPPLLK